MPTAQIWTRVGRATEVVGVGLLGCGGTEVVTVVDRRRAGAGSRGTGRAGRVRERTGRKSSAAKARLQTRWRVAAE